MDLFVNFVHRGTELHSGSQTTMPVLQCRDPHSDMGK